MDKQLKDIMINQIRENKPLCEMAKFWGMRTTELRKVIQDDYDLSVAFYVYKTSKRPYLYKKYESRKCFNIPLNRYGCRNLASAVIKRAMEDCDVNFFKSPDFTFYQMFLNSGLDSDDYLKCIE